MVRLVFCDEISNVKGNIIVSCCCNNLVTPRQSPTAYVRGGCYIVRERASLSIPDIRRLILINNDNNKIQNLLTGILIYIK